MVYFNRPGAFVLNMALNVAAGVGQWAKKYESHGKVSSAVEQVKGDAADPV